MLDHEWLEIRKEIGRRVGQEQRSSGLTDERLAQEVGISTRRLLTIKMGDDPTITLRELYGLADALGVGYTELMPS